MAGERPQNQAGPLPLRSACEACRQLKVRCMPGVSGPPPVCERCVKFNRTCVFAPPQKKKPRKRTDARIAELEKEIHAMRALLGQSEQPQAQRPLPPTLPTADRAESRSREANSVRNDAHSPPWPALSASDNSTNVSTQSRDPDVIDRGILSLSTAAELYQVFVHDLNAQLPIIAASEEYNVNQLRFEQPLLFLAIMASGSSKGRPELYSTLSTEAIQEYTKCMSLSGERSLELVMAMLVTNAWYFPATSWRHLKFYQYVHLASTIAMDIGLGEPGPYEDLRSSGYSTDANVAPAGPQFATDLKRARTLLACYSACASVSLSLRRPNMMRFTLHMINCANRLQNSPLQVDIQLLAFVRLTNMAEEIAVAFGLVDGPPATSLSDARATQIVSAFSARLDSWLQLYRDGLNTSLTLVYHYACALLFEHILHGQYSPLDFRAPFVMKPPIGLGSSLALSMPPPAEMVAQMVSPAQHALDLFLSQNVGFVRSMPNQLYARVAYVTVTLVKVALLDTLTPCSSSTSSYRTLTRVDDYLERLADRIAEAAGNAEYRVAAAFSPSFFRLRNWYLYQVQKWQSGKPLDNSYFSLFAGPDSHPALASSSTTPDPAAYPTPERTSTPDRSAQPDASASSLYDPFAGNNSGFDLENQMSWELNPDLLADEPNFFDDFSTDAFNDMQGFDGNMLDQQTLSYPYTGL